ncbi:MAG: thylakoid membrane photosystem I accumulation factor [Leptodesmis sp.]|uniref:thylakoid membrane photosystem I accumulation factor n=1 Tax=Leptodesmis TaxID=2664261 RepID=UPI001F1ED241
MPFSWLRSRLSLISPPIWRKICMVTLSVLLVLGTVTVAQVQPALASLQDDHYDGEIFALYAGNGSLIPPKVTLEQGFQRKRPVLLVFYVDDSQDCKQYSIVLSQLQAFYVRAADIIPIRADSIPPKSKYAPTEPGYYYKGLVPQTILFDETGKIVLNETGVLSFEQVDDKFREVFDLLPRSESAELKRRPLNEINTELVKQ